MPRLLLLGGMVVVAVYYVIAVQYGRDGHPAPAQTDALVYLQYARAIAEGHPYAYSAGALPTTGSTSHLFPALLAIPAWLGARGDALLTVAFLFNAACFLGWLQLFWLAARRLAPALAVPAALLVLANGQLLLAASGLTDMALFTLLAWGTLTALLYGRSRTAALLLVAAVLARPEGMLLTLGLLLTGAVLASRRNPEGRRLLVLSACGLAALALVFGLNLALTGFAQFQSVAQKGYFTNYPLLGALGCTARDFTTLVRELLFNAGTLPRQAFFLPVVGGVLAVVGVAAALRPSPQAPAVRWWLGSTLIALGLIAASEWQGLGTDRYLLWILPTWYLLALLGAGEIAAAWRSVRLLPMLVVLLAGYELAAWPFFASRYAAECARGAAFLQFARTADELLPPGAAVGTISGPAIAFGLGAHPVQHLFGITSAPFARQRDRLCAVEMLKHRPELRFPYLALTTPEQHGCAAAGILGDLVFADADAPPDGEVYALCTARWEAFPAAALQPLDPAVTNVLAGLACVDRLDVGYVPDETRCRYRTGTRLPGQFCKPCVATRAIGGLRVTEVGQPVLGWDEFRVRAPGRGRPLRIVLRTQLDATCTVIRATEKYAGEGLHLNTPVRITPIVNGTPLPPVALPVSADPATFTECVLDIPAAAVTSDPLEIALAGDHVALAYWFYQPSGE
jgi:hypothetical protein